MNPCVIKCPKSSLSRVTFPTRETRGTTNVLDVWYRYFSVPCTRVEPRKTSLTPYRICVELDMDVQRAWAVRSHDHGQVEFLRSRSDCQAGEASLRFSQCLMGPFRFTSIPVATLYDAGTMRRALPAYRLMGRCYVCCGFTCSQH